MRKRDLKKQLEIWHGHAIREEHRAREFAGQIKELEQEVMCLNELCGGYKATVEELRAALYMGCWDLEVDRLREENENLKKDIGRMFRERNPRNIDIYPVPKYLEVPPCNENTKNESA